MKAGIYLRVSTSQQGDGTSLETQEELCRAMAKQMGYDVHEEFVLRETWTGADLERPMLDRMRRAAREKLVDAEFVYNSDRLSRDPLHLLMLVQEFQDAGVSLHFVEGSLEDTPEGRLVLYVQGYAGQKERAWIARRTMEGKEKTAKSGRLPNGTGYGIFGCDYNRDAKTRAINEAEANVVRMMFRWASEGVSAYQIASRLNERNIRTKRGCQWHPLGVTRILRNRAYTGVQFYGENRYRKVKGGKREVTRRPASEVIRIEGFTPQIIKPALFEQVQERLGLPQAKATRSRNRCLMTGFTRCLQCGSPIVGACLHKSYRYYRCRATTPTSTRPATCSARYIPADDLEGYVWRRISEALLNPEVLVAELRRHFKTGSGDTQIGPVKALCDEKERALRVLEDQQRFKDDAAQMERRIAGLCRKLSRRLENLDFEGKRSLFAAFGLKVEATRDDVSITVVVDPEFTTIGQTSALPRGCSPRSRWGGTRRDWKRTRSQW